MVKDEAVSKMKQEMKCNSLASKNSRVLCCFTLVILVVIICTSFLSTPIDYEVDERALIFKSIGHLQIRKGDPKLGTQLGQNSRTFRNRFDNTTGRFNFTINTKSCTWAASRDKNKIKIGIIVLSKNNNFHQRYTIRYTWAKCTNCAANLELVFLLGSANNEAEQELINHESALFKDIVQVNLTERYDYLTYKSMAMLEWFHRYCYDSDVYIKADDDTYISINNIANAVSRYTVKHFFSSLIVNPSKPVRNTKSRHYVSMEQYDGLLYPPYCSGPAYLFSGNLLAGLYNASLVTTFMPIEDVFISGILVTKLDMNVAYIHSPKFMNIWDNKIDCRLKYIYSVHHADIKQIYSIHNFLELDKCS